MTELFEQANSNTSANLLATTVESLAPSTMPEIVARVVGMFLHRVSIACYAERCISYDRFFPTVCPTVRPSDRPSHAGIMPKRLQLRSCGLRCRIAP